MPFAYEVMGDCAVGLYTDKYKNESKGTSLGGRIKSGYQTIQSNHAKIPHKSRRKDRQVS